MGEASTKKPGKIKSWFSGLKAEFKRISWTDKDTVVKQTTAVVIISAVVSIIIAVLDTVIQYGVDFLVK